MLAATETRGNLPTVGKFGVDQGVVAYHFRYSVRMRAAKTIPAAGQVDPCLRRGASIHGPAAAHGRHKVPQEGHSKKLKDGRSKLLEDSSSASPSAPQADEHVLAVSIAEARDRAGLTQEEVAQRMQTTQSNIARLEAGRTIPSTRTLKKFAAAIGVRLKITFERTGRELAALPRKAKR